MLAYSSHHSPCCLTLLVENSTAPASSSLLQQTARGRDSPGTLALSCAPHQVPQVSRQLQQDPDANLLARLILQSRQPPGNRSQPTKNLISVLAFQPSLPQPNTAIHALQPLQPPSASRFSPGAEARQCQRGQAAPHLSTLCSPFTRSTQQVYGQAKCCCGRWRIASTKTLAWHRLRHTGSSATVLSSLCRLVHGPKIGILESLCWPAKAWWWKLRKVVLHSGKMPWESLWAVAHKVLQEQPALGSTLQHGLQHPLPCSQPTTNPSVQQGLPCPHWPPSPTLHQAGKGMLQHWTPIRGTLVCPTERTRRSRQNQDTMVVWSRGTT